jgi:hypothetical protein
MTKNRFKQKFTIVDGKGNRAAKWNCIVQHISDRRDVYLACMDAKGTIKASFHHSGDCQIEFVEEFYEDNKDVFDNNRQNRKMAVWHIPKEVKPGIFVLISIIVPRDSINIPMTMNDTKDTFLFENNTNTNSQVYITLVKANYAWKGTGKLKLMDLPNGDSLGALLLKRDDFKMPNATGKANYFNRANISSLKRDTMRALIGFEDAIGINGIIDSKLNLVDGIVQINF